MEVGTTGRFHTAFEALNGRAPTTEETKDALRYAQVVEQSGLDPFLLAFITDVRAKEQRDRLPEDVRVAVAEGVAEIRAVLPSMDDLAQRMASVAALKGSLDAVADAVRSVVIEVGAVIVVVVVLVVAVAVADFRWAYALGAGSNHEACVVLTHTKSLARQHEHSQTVGDISVALATLCR